MIYYTLTITSDDVHTLTTFIGGIWVGVYISAFLRVFK